MITREFDTITAIATPLGEGAIGIVRISGTDAVAIANDVRYGLNAGVYGPKQEAIAVAHRIQSGNVYINDSPRDTAAPFGGYKESGIGREGGVYGMIEFTQQKALFDTCKE